MGQWACLKTDEECSSFKQGSIYKNDDWYTEVEFSHKYLKSMFKFLGIEDYQIIRAQGTALLEPNEVLQKVYKEAEETASRLATK
ncbi:hypothetical protein GCM10009865_43170 [Aeromicrobium ponti]|uniref:FMN-dependent NADH-azoreductase n=1 Tax=Cytobacillus oceanisediminis TaxID=665099 RepID=A0A562J1F0_9BACI|nr:FMN-dependent NADH-azoreductase [Cytobacillus oceanisediminis]